MSSPHHTESFWNIIIQWTSHDDLTEKISCFISLAKLVKWQKCKTAICDLTEKLLASGLNLTQTFKLIWKPNAWMDLHEIKNLLYQFLFYFLQIKLFSPLMASMIKKLTKLQAKSSFFRFFVFSSYAKSIKWLFLLAELWLIQSGNLFVKRIL